MRMNGSNENTTLAANSFLILYLPFLKRLLLIILLKIRAQNKKLGIKATNVLILRSKSIRDKIGRHVVAMTTNGALLLVHIFLITAKNP